MQNSEFVGVSKNKGQNLSGTQVSIAARKASLKLWIKLLNVQILTFSRLQNIVKSL